MKYIVVLCILCLAAPVAAQEYMSAEDALNQALHTLAERKKPVTEREYVSAEEMLNYASQELQRRKTARSVAPPPVVQPAPVSQPATNPQVTVYPTYPTYPTYPMYRTYPTYRMYPVYPQQVYIHWQPAYSRPPVVSYAWAPYYPQTHTQNYAYQYPQPSFPAVDAVAYPQRPRREHTREDAGGTPAIESDVTTQDTAPAALVITLPVPPAAEPAQMKIETKTAKTEVIIPANLTQAQQDTLTTVSAHQLALEELRLEYERETERLKWVILVSFAVSVPLILAIGWALPRMLHEMRYLIKAERGAR
ncbi:MAG: hypothetical protein GY726_03890 [Proteobacteria bacterium]|nr:hypothetical protein [Pseudomonadota bacterium]